MQTIAEELRVTGVREDRIIYLDLDRYGFRSVKTPDQLEALIEPALKIGGMKYLFINEVQNVEGFEEVVNEFRAEGGFSIFITGSNSYLLSGELATKLTGRYVEFEVQTLSFRGYREMKRFLGRAVDPQPCGRARPLHPRGRLPQGARLPQDGGQARLRDLRHQGDLREGHPPPREGEERLGLRPGARPRHQQLRRDGLAREHPIRPRAAGRAHQARDAQPLPPETRGRQDHQQVRAST